MHNQTPQVTHIWQFDAAFTEQGWIESPSFLLDQHHRIIDIKTSEPLSSFKDAVIEKFDGWLIPGLTNSHSHAFQYAMAGLAEHCDSQGCHINSLQQSNFWTWRTFMYQIANQITPDQLTAIAAMLYSEMLRHGYTSVVEFHYLHHQPDGKPYEREERMSEALIQAAQIAGIGLTLVPVLYERGGFGKTIGSEQKRFYYQGFDQYMKMIEKLNQTASHAAVPDMLRIGVGAHSLRAAIPQHIQNIVNLKDRHVVHLHIAEQLQEVEDCLQHLKLRPVEWLLEQCDINEKVNLVHATHTTAAELMGVAKRGAQIVLCPSTEGNLGDGIFALKQFLSLNGSIAIGSDSHIGLQAFEELRWLDYQQRLVSHQRNPLCNSQQLDSGDLLFRAALVGGRKSAAISGKGYFPKNSKLDGVLIDHHHPIFASKSAERRLAALVFASDASVITGAIQDSQWVVHQQRHHHYDEIYQNYLEAMAALLSAG